MESFPFKSRTGLLIAIMGWLIMIFANHLVWSQYSPCRQGTTAIGEEKPKPQDLYGH